MTDGSCNSHTGHGHKVGDVWIDGLGDRWVVHHVNAGWVGAHREIDRDDYGPGGSWAIASIGSDPPNGWDRAPAPSTADDDRADGPGASEAYIRRWLTGDEHDVAPAHGLISSWLVDGLRAVVADLDRQRALVSDAEDLHLHYSCDSCGAPLAQGPCSKHCDNDE